MLAAFPLGDKAMIDERAKSEMSAVIEVISKVRNIRSEMNIKPAERLTVHIASAEAYQRIFQQNEPQIKKLARADTIIVGSSLNVPKASAKAVTNNAEIAVPLEGLIDFDKERSRLQGQITKLDVELQRLNGQLSNQNFVSKAPAEKVQELRDRQVDITQQISALQNNLNALQ
jgi:valyl-tRNA synthetase